MDTVTSLHTSARRTLVAVCLAALTIGLSACSHQQKSEVPLVPVTGEVIMEGKPLEEATVEYIPAGSTPGQGGSGLTDAKGFFEISSPFGEPGLTGGDYTVIVSKFVLPPGAVINPDRLGPADNPGRELVAPQYSSRAMPTLKAKVPTSGKAHHKLTVKRKTGPGMPGMPSTPPPG